LVTPEPKKRPKSSYRRFQADQPNECWQSDFTHWQLADGSGVEIINWLDDHSRYLLASRAYRRVSGQTVITTFLAAAEAYGLPQSTLTDNRSVYTSRFTGGRNARPHRALHGAAPAQAYSATIKAGPLDQGAAAPAACTTSASAQHTKVSQSRASSTPTTSP
jgi:transposase InsO family protein